MSLYHYSKQDKKMPKLTILDIFHQSAQEGIPPHWCVQYKTEQSGFAQYEYFNTSTEAREFAMTHGYED